MKPSVYLYAELHILKMLPWHCVCIKYLFILLFGPDQQLRPRLLARPSCARLRFLLLVVGGLLQVGVRDVHLPQLAEGAQVRAVLHRAQARLPLLHVAALRHARLLRLGGGAALHRIHEQSFRTSHLIFHSGELDEQRNRRALSKASCSNM